MRVTVLTLLAAALLAPTVFGHPIPGPLGDECGGTAPGDSSCSTDAHFTGTGLLDVAAGWRDGFTGKVVSIADFDAIALRAWVACNVVAGAGTCRDETGATVGSCGTGGAGPCSVVKTYIVPAGLTYRHEGGTHDPESYELPPSSGSWSAATRHL